MPNVIFIYLASTFSVFQSYAHAIDNPRMSTYELRRVLSGQPMRLPSVGGFSYVLNQHHIWFVLKPSYTFAITAASFKTCIIRLQHDNVVLFRLRIQRFPCHFLVNIVLEGAVKKTKLAWENTSGFCILLQRSMPARSSHQHTHLCW